MCQTNTFTMSDTEYTFRIGRNKHDNWNLLDASSPEDIWFHVADKSSCYVILDAPQHPKTQDQLKQLLQHGATLCKQHSSSRDEPKVKVVYTHVRNLTKGRHVGQVVVSPGSGLFLKV
jgi:predicted ribosome quality control (RQC) complex YloA/Tae2 family protein